MLGVVLVVMAVIVLILYLLERKLKNLKSKKDYIHPSIRSKLSHFKNSKIPIEKRFSLLDKYARDFAYKKFRIGKSRDYSALIEIAEKKKDMKVRDFLKNMENAMYSGKKLDERVIGSLVGQFENSIRK